MGSQDVRAVVDVLRGCRRVLVITGAGMSAESGLPTYRGIGGLYEGDGTSEGIPIEEAISGRMLRTRPAITWRVLRQLESACRGAKPNVGHEVIARMEERFDRVVVLTQNVDGLHQAAGSQHVVDIHGDIHDLMCTSLRCGWRARVEGYEGLADEPSCPSCGGPIRPDVVLFGEMLSSAKLSTLYKELDRGMDVVFSIGTTSVFPYIASPMLDAARLGIPTVEINLSETAVSHYARYGIRRPAAGVLEAIWQHLGE